MAQVKQSQPNTADSGSDIARSQDSHTPGDGPEKRGRSTAEKITTAISILLITALAGAILYEGYATGQADPAVLKATVLTDEIEQRDDAFHVPVEVLNDGDQTVEEITVSLEVRDGEQIVDEAETVIMILGESESTTTVFVLTEDPAGLTIEAGVDVFQIADD